jgi:undecaprenyl-diphosphatase
MTFLDAAILGIIQGLTEFLPVSSSGHLVIGQAVLGLNMPGISMEIWLHFGTLLAVLIYFRKRIISLIASVTRPTKEKSHRENRFILVALLLGSIPAAVVGLALKSFIETAFDSPAFAGGMLIATGLILLLTRWYGGGSKDIKLSRGFAIGLAQAAAILPGISRSGSTIACGMFLGVKPATAAEFSFLLAIPAVGGAFLLDLISSKGGLFSDGKLALYLSGTIIAFVFGILSIHYLLKIVKKGRLYFFGFYCLVVGAVSLVYLG